MPKRKKVTDCEEDLNKLRKKIRKLERKIHNQSESVSPHSASMEFEPQNIASPILRPEDWFPEYPDEDLITDPINPYEEQLHPVEDSNNPVEDQHNYVENQPKPIEVQQDTQCTLTNTQATSSNTSAIPVASTSTVDPIAANEIPGEGTSDLDKDILQILGDDPSTAINYGKDIRTEIASRFVHAVTEGITKENRKDLITKYPIPGNCVKIGAPKLNPEIKAAISENFTKRDKGIESKQKEMASAISCLGEIITLQLNAKEKNNDLLQKLMDLSRILCDLQYADSVTRRNFILFSLKKDLKDHLVDTKIDTYLFGENLTETLKTAKAVIKSGVEIKAATPKQQTATQYRRIKSTVSRPLNRRGPAARRPPPGPPAPPAPTPRGRAPAPRVPAPPHPAPPARYYRPSHAYQPQQRRY